MRRQSKAAEGSRRQKKARQCPEGWDPGCSCRPDSLEPDENCHIHGVPDRNLDRLMK